MYDAPLNNFGWILYWIGKLYAERYIIERLDPPCNGCQSGWNRVDFSHDFETASRFYQQNVSFQRWMQLPLRFRDQVENIILATSNPKDCPSRIF